MFGDALSQVAREVDQAMLILLAVCLALLVGITVTMVAFVIRFRRSKSPTTRQVHKHTVLEVAWTVIPTILVLGLFFVGYKGFVLMRNPPADAMEIQVLGQQWFWTFTYPGTGVSSPELVLPVDTPVKLHLRSVESDVIHSLYIPAFRIKEDVVPGMDTFLWIQADQTGTFNIFCAEFCGKDHSKMITKLRIVPKADYAAWLDRQVAERFRPVDAAKALQADSEELKGYDGKALYGQYCAACHGAGGEGGGPYKSRDFRKATEWKRSPKLTDIVATLSTGLDGTQMRSFGHLPVRERFALAHQVASFLVDGTRPPVAEADLAELRRRFPETDPASNKAAAPTKPILPMDEAMRRVVEGQAP